MTKHTDHTLPEDITFELDGEGNLGEPEAKTTEVGELSELVAKLQEEVAQAKASELRSRADYQNLVRRTQQEKIKSVKFATRDLVESLLQPLDHLSLAAAQLNDKGLNMVIDQLWRALNDQGVEEIKVLHQPFDAETMEVVDTKSESDQVTSVVRKGYRLNGEVIQHAKVIVG